MKIKELLKEKIDELNFNTFYELGFNRNADTDSYLEFLCLKYGQNTRNAAFNQLMHNLMKTDEEFQEYLNKRKQLEKKYS